MLHEIHNPECFANHMGMYMAEPSAVTGMIDAIKDGTLRARSLADIKADHLELVKMNSGGLNWINAGGMAGYFLHSSGVAVVHMTGMLMKGQSKYGGTSTIGVRKALRAAKDDPNVSACLLCVDSPGGHVAGMVELADSIAQFSKPIAAHADDLMASAAYGPSTQVTDGITANRSAEVGSIGTVAVLADTSGKAEAEGIKVHVISTGSLKGAFSAGVEITQEQIDYMQERVDSLNGNFLQLVETGRGMTPAQVKAAATGAVFSAAKAVELGLIDGIMSMDDALSQMINKYGRQPNSKDKGRPAPRPRAAAAAARIAAMEKYRLTGSF